MTTLLKSVKGLRVMVTGGGSGLGAATVSKLIKGGARVVVVDIKDQASVRTAPPSGALFCQADIVDETAVSQAMSVTKSKFGGLDAVVNCAGEGLAARIYNWNTDLPFKQDDFNRLLRVNALGTFNVCRLAAQLMAQNLKIDKANNDKLASLVQRGVIVNTSSIASTDGQATQVMYAASKAALSAMTLPLSRDLAPLGIRVCCIAPGYFNSPMCSREGYPPRVQKFLADHNRSIYRLGRPEEFAIAVEAVLLNPMLNGVCIRLDAASRGFFYNRRTKAVPLVSKYASSDGKLSEDSATSAPVAAEA